MLLHLNLIAGVLHSGWADVETERLKYKVLSLQSGATLTGRLIKLNREINPTFQWKTEPRKQRTLQSKYLR